MGPEQSEQIARIASLQEKLADMDPIDYQSCVFFRDQLPKWKALNPEVLVIAPQAATVYQPLIKTAWTTAFGEQGRPRIINIDPNALNQSGSHDFSLKESQLLEKTTRVIVFDDSSRIITNEKKPIKYSPEKINPSDEPKSLEKIGSYLNRIGVKEVWLDWGKTLWPSTNDSLIERKQGSSGLTLGRREKGPERLRVMAKAKQMRELGQFVADLIKYKVP